MLIKNSGFTLLEVLVVLIILSSMMLLVSLNPNVLMSKNAALEKTATLLQQKLILLRETAIFQQTVFRVSINEQGYAFSKLTYSEGDFIWEPLKNHRLLKAAQFSKDIKLNYHPKQVDKENRENTISMDFYPNGSSSDFKVMLEDANCLVSYELVSNNTGITGINKIEKKI